MVESRSVFFVTSGDLKTFLLSRRQLVGQSNKEAEDISCQALTQMALDVALGLQYLASLKYVHRSVIGLLFPLLSLKPS